MLNVLRLFKVGLIVQSSRSVFSLAWHEWFSCKGGERKIYCWMFALWSEPQIRQLHARVARLFLFIQPIKWLICGVVVAVPVAISKLSVALEIPRVVHHDNQADVFRNVTQSFTKEIWYKVDGQWWFVLYNRLRAWMGGTIRTSQIDEATNHKLPIRY